MALFIGLGGIDLPLRLAVLPEGDRGLEDHRWSFRSGIGAWHRFGVALDRRGRRALFRCAAIKDCTRQNCQ